MMAIGGTFNSYKSHYELLHWYLGVHKSCHSLRIVD